MVNSVSFYGSETAGSIGKLTSNAASRVAPMQEDKVNFRGTDSYDQYESKKKKSSIGMKILMATTAAVALVGGLGYAHKAGWVDKLGQGKIRDAVNYVTEPCHNLCAKTKGYCVKAFDTVKGWFGKKS